MIGPELAIGPHDIRFGIAKRRTAHYIIGILNNELRAMGFRGASEPPVIVDDGTTVSVVTAEYVDDENLAYIAALYTQKGWNKVVLKRTEHVFENPTDSKHFLKPPYYEYFLTVYW